MAVTLSSHGGKGSNLQDGQSPLRSLLAWLVSEDELRGRVKLVQPRPNPGELGALADTLQVLLAPGGAVAVLAAAVVSWTRRQRSDLRVTLHRGDSVIAEVEATRLRGLDAATLPAVVDSLRRSLNGETSSAAIRDAGRAALPESDADDAARVSEKDDTSTGSD